MKNQRIVISRPDRIGDVIISTSCLAPLREKFPAAPICFIAAESLRPLLENHPLLAGFVSLSSDDLTTELKRTDAKSIVHLHPNEHCYRAAYEAEIPIRIGYRPSCRELTHAIADRRGEGLQHEGEYCFDLLKYLGVEKPKKLRPTIHLADLDRSSLEEKLPWSLETTRFAVINGSAYSAKKEWPMERFMNLAERIRTEFELSVVFVGLNDSHTYPAQHLNLTRQTNLGELAWLLKYAQILVSNDTGVSHIAAAVDCPSVVIFGRTDPQYGPARWRPLSDRAVAVTSATRRKRFEPTRAFWRRSFAAIEVEPVIVALRELLNQSRATANSLPKLGANEN
jgi:heptosyltransferase II